MTQQNRIPLEENEISVVLDETLEGENGGWKYNVKFTSLEGYEITWKKEQAEQLKSQILQDAKIVDEIRKKIEYIKQHRRFWSDYDVECLLQQLLGEKE